MSKLNAYKKRYRSVGSEESRQISFREITQWQLYSICRNIKERKKIKILQMKQNISGIMNKIKI